MLQLQQGGIIEKMRNDVYWNQAKSEREDLRLRRSNFEENLVIAFYHIISPILLLAAFLVFAKLGFLGELLHIYHVKKPKIM